MEPNRRAETRSRRAWVLGVLLVLAVWAGFDLYGPLRIDLRDFDHAEVARLDTVMWRSYYHKQPLPLFLQMIELMQRQFHFPPLRASVAAYHAAKAAFVFKRGHARPDYELALPDLRAYFGAIRRASRTPFDVERASRLELEWWIVHRQRGVSAPGDLQRALAEAAGALYQVPADSLMAYGHWRADAMGIRDTRAAAGGVSDAEWGKIHRELDESWKDLWVAVRGRRGAKPI